MSQRKFTFIHPSSHRMFYVTAGWDRPLQYHFLTIEDDVNTEPVFCNLELENPAMSIDDIRVQLAERDIKTPPGFFEQLEKDREDNAGNASSTLPFMPADIELKAVKVHEELSEETYAYTASLYINGKKVADVSNHGHGGPDSLWPTENGRDLLKQTEEALKELEPHYDPRWDTSLDITIDLICGTLVGRHMARKDALRLTKKNKRILVLSKNDLDTESYDVYATAWSDHRARRIIMNKHGQNTFFLNCVTRPVGPFRLEMLDMVM